MSKKLIQSAKLNAQRMLVPSLSALGFALSASKAFAQDTLKPPAGSVATDIKAEAIPQLIINGIFLVAAFLAVMYLMYGGIKWITSRGDKMAVESARKHIVAAIIGLVVVAGSFFALNVVFQILGAENPLERGFKLPTLKDAAR